MRLVLFVLCVVSGVSGLRATSATPPAATPFHQVAAFFKNLPQAVSSPTPETPAVKASPTTPIHQVATFLAGIPQGLPYEQEASWQAYAASMQDRWSTVDGARFRPMRHWQSAQLPQEEGLLFYPMGGPDVVYPMIFFPKAKTYILVGLERVGPIPTQADFQNQDARTLFLMSVQEGTASLFQRSFFITKDMSRDYAAGGVVGSLLALLVRQGKQIQQVRHVQYTPEGQIMDTPNGVTPHGVEITFLSEGAQAPQTLYYFRQNLNNGNLTPFAQFMRTKAPFALMIKSASYVPHQAGFEQLTAFLQENARLILQDDTGVPYRFLKAGPWKIRLFGHYERPYGSEFDPYIQKDLAEAYAPAEEGKPSAVESLPFRIGYGYSKAPSNMLLAVRDQSPISTTSASAHYPAVQSGDKGQPVGAN